MRVAWPGTAVLADRNIIIDRDNKMLLKRMEEIHMTPQMDCFLDRKDAQSNYVYRVMRMQEINRQNQVSDRVAGGGVMRGGVASPAGVLPDSNA